MATLTKHQDFVLSENGGGIVPNATITVYLFGTSTKAALFADSSSMVAVANPVQADASGYYWFYGDNTLHYTLVFSGFGMTPRTLTDVLLPGGGTSGTVGPPGPPGAAGGVSWGIVPTTNDWAGLQEAVYLAFDQGLQGVGWPVVILQPGVVYNMGDHTLEIRSRTGAIPYNVSNSSSPLTLADLSPNFPVLGTGMTGGFAIWCPTQCVFDCTQFASLHPAINYISTSTHTNGRIEGIHFYGNSTFSIGTRIWGTSIEVKRCLYKVMKIGHVFAACGVLGIYTEQCILSDCTWQYCQKAVQWANFTTLLGTVVDGAHFISFRGSGLRGRNTITWTVTDGTIMSIDGYAFLYLAPLEVDVSTGTGSTGRAYLIENNSSFSGANFFGNINSETGLAWPLIIGKNQQFMFRGGIGGNRGYTRLGSCRLGRHLASHDSVSNPTLQGEEFTIADHVSLNGAGVQNVSIYGTCNLYIQIKSGSYDCRYRVTVNHAGGAVGNPDGNVTDPPDGSVTVDAVCLEIDIGGYGTFTDGSTTFRCLSDGAVDSGVTFQIVNTGLINHEIKCWVVGMHQAENERKISNIQTPAAQYGADYSRATAWTVLDGTLTYVDATHFRIQAVPGNTNSGVSGSRTPFQFIVYVNRAIVCYSSAAAPVFTHVANYTTNMTGTDMTIETADAIDPTLFEVGMYGT